MTRWAFFPSSTDKILVLVFQIVAVFDLWAFGETDETDGSTDEMVETEDGVVGDWKSIELFFCFKNSEFWNFPIFSSQKKWVWTRKKNFFFGILGFNKSEKFCLKNSKFSKIYKNVYLQQGSSSGPWCLIRSVL